MPFHTEDVEYYVRIPTTDGGEEVLDHSNDICFADLLHFELKDFWDDLYDDNPTFYKLEEMTINYRPRWEDARVDATTINKWLQDLGVMFSELQGLSYGDDIVLSGALAGKYLLWLLHTIRIVEDQDLVIENHVYLRELGYDPYISFLLAPAIRMNSDMITRGYPFDFGGHAIFETPRASKSAYNALRSMKTRQDKLPPFYEQKTCVGVTDWAVGIPVSPDRCVDHILFKDAKTKQDGLIRTPYISKKEFPAALKSAYQSIFTKEKEQNAA